MNTYTDHDRKREKAFICWTEGEKDNPLDPATVTAKAPNGRYYSWIYDSDMHAFLAGFNEAEAPGELHGLSIAAAIREYLTPGDLYGTRLYIDDDGEIQDVSIY